MAFWAVVFCEDAVTFCVEDDEGLDAVEREVHLGVVVSGGELSLVTLISKMCWEDERGRWLCTLSHPTNIQLTSNMDSKL